MKSNLKSNLVYSVLGVVFNTIFPLITYPYVTRKLGVASLGEYNFYASTVAYMALVAGFGISLHGTKLIGKYADNKDKYSQVFGDLLTINLILVGIVYVFAVFLMIFGAHYQNTKLFIITSITILTECIGAEFIFVALERQKFMLIRNVIFKIISLVCIFLFIKGEEDLLKYAGIMLLSTAGISITNIMAYKGLINWKSIHINYKDLVPYIMPLFQVFLMNLLIHYYGMMDVVVLGNMGSVEDVGYYSTASKLYGLSYAFLASTAIPLLPRASYYLEKGLTAEYNGLIKKCYDIYVIFIVFISFILFFYSEEIVTLVAGGAFANSSMPLKYFSLTLFFSSLCNCFIFQVFYPHDKAKWVLISQVIGIGINVLLSILLIPLYSYNGAAIAFFVSYVFLFISMLITGRSIIPKFSGFRDLIKETVALMLCIITAILLRETNVYFLFSICLCALLYFIVGILTKNEALLYLTKIVINKFKGVHE